MALHWRKHAPESIDQSQLFSLPWKPYQRDKALYLVVLKCFIQLLGF